MQHIHRSPAQIAADRARYEDHQRRGLEFAPKAMPEASERPAPEPEAGRILHREVIPGGWYWSTRLRTGESIRIAPEMGGRTGTVALVAWSAADASERMNLPDTVKVQWTTDLGKGRVIFSDMGRVLLSITEDSSGAHDALTGGSSAATNLARYGDALLRNTRENLVLLAGKAGFDRRDLPGHLNLFAPVRVDAEGRFEWRGAMLSGEDWVELRAEMDLVVGLSLCPHPLDPAPEFDPPAMVATRLSAISVPADDLCRTASAEAIRGFANNARA